MKMMKTDATMYRRLLNGIHEEIRALSTITNLVTRGIGDSVVNLDMGLDDLQRKQTRKAKREKSR
jgi:hypothetical protein